MNEELESVCFQLSQCFIDNHLTITTAESCTAGLVAAALTDLPGSSAYFQRGFITYSNQAKHEMLGVDNDSLLNHGAVSEVVAKQMAAGAKQQASANIAVAVTGIAGPDGGSAEKPVGTVCFAWALPDGRVESSTQQFKGDRQQVRQQSVHFVLNDLLSYL